MGAAAAAYSAAVSSAAVRRPPPGPDHGGPGHTRGHAGTIDVMRVDVLAAIVSLRINQVRGFEGAAASYSYATGYDTPQASRPHPAGHPITRRA